jgi:hypothetical protein
MSKLIPWAEPKLDNPKYVYVICPECEGEIEIKTTKAREFWKHYIHNHAEKIEEAN